MAQNTSTPKHKPRVDLHRKSILNRFSSIKESSPLRKNDSVSLAKHDDSKERSTRNDQIISRSVSNREVGSDRTFRPSNRTSQTSYRASIRFGDDEAREHLQSCHKLFAENKITAKNVWGLKIIDVLAHMVIRKKEANLLIIASTGLDVSAKVYGIRVDDLHSFGMRLASHLMKTQSKQQDRESDNDENENIENKPNKARKGKSKKFKFGGKKPTIDYEGTSLFAPLKKLQKPQFSIDDKLENGAIENLLTSRLPIHPFGHTFRIFNNEKYSITEPDITVQNQSVMEVQLPMWQNAKICPSFDKFVVNQDAEFFDLTTIVNDVAFDNNGIPIPELDGSIHDPFVADNDVNMTEENEEMIVDQHQQYNSSQQRIIEIIDAIPEDEREENEYNFNALVETANGRIVDKLWAGPSHWKVKFIKRSLFRCSSNTVVDQQICKQDKRKRKKPITPTGVILNMDEAKITTLTTDNKYKDRKQSALIDMAIKDTIQPQLSYEVVEFEQKIDHLLTKPETIVNLRTRQLLNDNGGMFDNFNDNNDHNSSHFSLHNNDDDHYSDNDNEIIGSQNHLNENNMENFEDELVDAPQTINVKYLTYALHAKKINMKKLKQAVWNRLTKNQIDDNENHVEPMKFSQLYRETPKQIDATMAKDLSVALVFNSVLYLTNEKSLVITQKKMNIADFIISK